MDSKYSPQPQILPPCSIIWLTQGCYILFKKRKIHWNINSPRILLVHHVVLDNNTRYAYSQMSPCSAVCHLRNYNFCLCLHLPFWATNSFWYTSAWVHLPSWSLQQVPTVCVRKSLNSTNSFQASRWYSEIYITLLTQAQHSSAVYFIQFNTESKIYTSR